MAIDAEKIKRAVNDKMFPHWVDDLASAINAELERIQTLCATRHRLKEFVDGPANEMPKIYDLDLLKFADGTEEINGVIKWNTADITEIWRQHEEEAQTVRIYKRIWQRKP